jgi:hypothetical protein
MSSGAKGVVFEESGKKDMVYELLFPLFLCTGPQTRREQTDVFIRLHASLEVGTRDDLCGSMFA